MITLFTVSLGDIGGISGIAAACAWAATQFFSWYSKRKDVELKESDQDAQHTSAAVTDAATVNSVMLDTLRNLQGEIQRLHTLNSSLNTQLAEKDKKIIEMQKEIERLVMELTNLYNRLEDLRSN